MAGLARHLSSSVSPDLIRGKNPRRRMNENFPLRSFGCGLRPEFTLAKAGARDDKERKEKAENLKRHDAEMMQPQQNRRGGGGGGAERQIEILQRAARDQNDQTACQ